MKLISISFIALLSGCATAVSGSNDETDAGKTTSTKDSGTTTSKDSGSTKVYDAGNANDAATSTDDDSGTIDDSTCAAQTTKAQCEQCCLTVHQEGYQVYNSTLTQCACQSPGTCASDCASEACANQPTTQGDACDTCMTNALSSSGDCYDAVSTACQGDPDCTELFETCIPPCENMQ